jgi:hypothetical protein
MGAWFDDAAIARPAVNADVEKATDQEAEEEREEGFDHRVTRAGVGAQP